ncbi:NAD(P)-binding domain-containing protein [Aerosakkonemataceae cyanobacterium BLCC-F50]|uniref:NAD(P)-binding domain-containing protein n=1 Tax=Floridaenema flaviceps BLCC-F50 TaxID=3153642 RepID=A0ABV4Y035_9CYAN
MKIAFIGVGNVGTALADRLQKLGQKLSREDFAFPT